MNINWTNPYKNGGKTWLKGNLHAHTTVSDGTLTPLEAMRLNKSKGHSFFAITDHGIVSNPGDYPPEIILIPGIEADFNHNFHIGTLGPDPAKIFFDKQMTPQEYITCNAESGNVVIINHPNYELNEHFTIEQLFALKGYTAIEIYNSLCERSTGSPLATTKWDRLMANGIKLLGFANQDSHELADYSETCNVVHVDHETKDDILNALMTGNFYCYNGVEIAEIGRTGDTIHVKTENAKLIRFIGRGGIELKKVKDKESSITFGEHRHFNYLRVECLGVGEEISWSQPFFR